MNSMESPERPEAANEWLGALRARLLSVARRRVAPAAAEDLVQETLRILVEKGVRGPADEPPGGATAIVYAFRVLRNVIGNHYQRERVRTRTSGPAAAAALAPDPAPTPLEALSSRQAVEIVRACLASMTSDDGACERYLRRLLEGLTPRDLAHEEGLEERVLYRRVYRCRLKLRALLEQRGVLA